MECCAYTAGRRSKTKTALCDARLHFCTACGQFSEGGHIYPPSPWIDAIKESGSVLSQETGVVFSSTVFKGEISLLSLKLCCSYADDRESECLAVYDH